MASRSSAGLPSPDPDADPVDAVLRAQIQRLHEQVENAASLARAATTAQEVSRHQHDLIGLSRELHRAVALFDARQRAAATLQPSADEGDEPPVQLPGPPPPSPRDTSRQPEPAMDAPLAHLMPGPAPAGFSDPPAAEPHATSQLKAHPRRSKPAP